jgi:O-antigen/teichoic acid export membrane protein
METSKFSLSRFIGGTISVGAGSLAATVLGLLGTMIASRHLSTEAFGIFVLLQVVASFLTQISSFGLNDAVTKFVTGTRDVQSKRQLINTAISLRLFTILIVSLAAFIVKLAFPTLLNPSSLSGFSVFIPVLFLLQSMMSLLQSMLRAFFHFKRISITAFIASFINFALVLVFLLVLDWGVIGLIYARVISFVLSCTFAYLSIPIKKKFEFHFDAIKEVLRFGAPLQINDIMTLMFSRIDTLIISILLGHAEIAYYEIARKIPDTLMRLYEAFSAVYFPSMSELFARGERQSATSMLNHSVRWISFLTIFISLIALLFGRDLIVLLFTEKYSPSASVFILLTVGVNLVLTEYTLGYSLVALGDPGKPAIVNAVHAVTNLLGNILLIPNYGVLGAALANIAGNAIGILLDVLFLRGHAIDVKNRYYLKPILIFGVYWLLVLFVKPSALLLKFSIGVLFTGTCVLFSVITVKDLSIILKEISKILSKTRRNLHLRETKV